MEKKTLVFDPETGNKSFVFWKIIGLLQLKTCSPYNLVEFFF